MSNENTLRETNVLSPVQLTDNYLSESDWRVKENSNVDKSIGGLILYQSGAIASAYWLNKVYSKEVSEAHKNCDFHLHDLTMLSPYCFGWDIGELLERGMSNVKNKIQTLPAKHLSTACHMLVNFLGIFQNEAVGAQALNNFDTYLAPFIKQDNLDDIGIRQGIQNFLFGINVPSRWGCFDTNTYIETENGWKTLGQIKEGDLIWTFNTNTKIKELKPIRKIIEKEDNSFIRLLSDNYEQVVTEEHNVLMNDCSFKKACDVRIGDILINGVIVKNIEKFTTKMQKIWCINTENKTIYASRNYKEFLTGNTQAPFSNITLDFTVPKDLKDKKPKIGGKTCNFTYGDCQPEMDRLNKVLIEELLHGDGKKGLFQYPVVTVNVDKNFRWDHPITDLLFKLTALTGNPYFSNYVNTDFGPEDIRSMCVVADTLIDVELEEDYIDFKKGLMLSLPISTDTKYKVKTNNGYESPIQKEKLSWAGPIIIVIMDDGQQTCLKSIPEHEYLVYENNSLVERKAKDLKVGDLFENRHGEKIAIKSIKDGYYDGDVFSFQMPSRNYYVNGYLTKNCCRLRLDLKQLRRNETGGLFGSGSKTGSIGVVTLNMPRIGYLSQTHQEFFSRLDRLLDLASESLETKRMFCEEMLKAGMYPYIKEYLGTFNNHFSTIGLIGMHECCLNFLGKGIETTEGSEFTISVLNHMRDKMSYYQEQTGHLYNLEATPAESTSYRLAKHDKEKYPAIKASGEQNAKPYYTNSSNLPVGYTDDPWVNIRHQEPIQALYTGGCVVHLFNDGNVKDYTKVKEFIKNVLENSSLPYITYTPNIRICKKHGILESYDNGNTICPFCQEEAKGSYSKKLEELKKQRDELVRQFNNC